ncbi:MAG TPA: adenylate/guanylate cyclase domain-containing protein [Spirochaetes bacterium]|nr:adenylate/guanylate cyclase domain-containing protein [Spirochaetota bacterium]
MGEEQEIQTEESRTIHRAEKVLGNDKLDKKSYFHDEYSYLFKQYKKLIKQMEKMVKMGDIQQQKVTKLNQRLDLLAKNLSKYVSPQIFDLMQSEKEDIKIQSHRTQLTVFFSDIVDFTSSTENLQPEDTTRILNEYLEEMSQIALKFGGTIDKFIGDAVMIFFGDPQSKGMQEDALTCVAMAIEMQKKLIDLRRIWSNRGLQNPFKVRIGIASGYCTVGNFGSNNRLDYTIIGSIVNLASRLESSAKPDDILVSHETYSLIKDKIYCEKEDVVMVKGIPFPVQKYKVIDFYGNLKVHEEISEYFDGFSIYVDLDYIPQNNIDQAISYLDQSINALKKLKE